ncbi:LysE family translocator [Paludibacterium purpuratum]|uniref:Threonine/homoserine/homoserine lactone efflux protein n=1 Tax=Paludibacterium purpuratum TaxID=1144873 RepID=A0A4R7B1L2_9NEIS|nr:LysE family translocator [Paludibacterium purpuratum]TDR73827.1 threonine/homoserine/homoserine lactone efflux protein [Paludibacterium purpuratum]
MPVTLDQLLAFLATSVLITLAPGPDNLAVLSLGIANGRKPGMLFGLGCALGCLNHTVLAALGVGALIAASPTAFTLLKLAGGAYLIYLGVQALRSGGARFESGAPSPSQPWRRYLVRGVLASAINPKVVLFFLAFLPQFVDMKRGHVGLQIAVLGTLFAMQGAVLFGVLGYFSGMVGQALKKKPGIGQWLDRLAGSVFILLGAKLALSQGK